MFPRLMDVKPCVPHAAVGSAVDHRKAYESLRWPQRMATVTRERFSENSGIEVVSVLDGKAVRQRVPFSYALTFA